MIKKVLSHEWLKPQHSAVTLELVPLPTTAGYVAPSGAYDLESQSTVVPSPRFQSPQRSRTTVGWEEHLVSVNIKGKSLETMPRFVSVKVASTAKPPPSTPTFDNATPSHGGFGWQTVLQGLMVSDGANQIRFKVPLLSTVRFLQLHFKGTVQPVEGSIRHLVDLGLELADGSSIDDDRILVQEKEVQEKEQAQEKMATTPPPSVAEANRSTSGGGASTTKESLRELDQMKELRAEITELEAYLRGLQHRVEHRDREVRKATSECYDKLQLEHETNETRFRLEQHEYQLLLARMRPNLLTPSLPSDLPISTERLKTTTMMVASPSPPQSGAGRTHTTTMQPTQRVLDLSPAKRAPTGNKGKLIPEHYLEKKSTERRDTVEESPSAVLKSQKETPPREQEQPGEHQQQHATLEESGVDTVVSPVSSSASPHRAYLGSQYSGQSQQQLYGNYQYQGSVGAATGGQSPADRLVRPKTTRAWKNTL